MPIHPIAVHFTIGLLVSSGLLLIVHIFFHPDWLLKSILLILIPGTLASFGAVRTGHLDESISKNIPEIHAAIEQHEESGETVRLYFALLSLLVLISYYLKKADLTLVRWVLGILAMAGIFLVYQAGDFGGKLVYQRGAGVEPVIELFQQKTE